MNDLAPSKTCPSCHRSLTISSFSRDSSTKSGLSCYCKDCKRSKRSQKEKERSKERSRAWYQENKEKQKYKQAIYRSKNKDKRRALARKYKKRDVALLADNYVRGTLLKLGFAKSMRDIPDEFVNAYRLVMAIRRESRKEQ